MHYSIFRNNILLVNVKPFDSSEHSQKMQTEDVVRLNFALESFINIMVGDYIIFEKTNSLYYLNKPPRVIESPMNYQYECIFEGAIHQLRKTKVLLTTPKEDGDYYIDYSFPLSGNAQTFLQFIVENLNRNGGNYIAGVYKQTDTINIDFNNWNVFEAITEISNQLQFNWYLENNTLNFDAKNYQTNYLFQVGRKSGLTKLTQLRNDSQIETVVYGYGSMKNLPPRTADSGITYDSENLTDNRLMFAGVDGESRLEKNTALYGRIESVQEFDIYPTRTGVVSSITPSNRRLFIDSTMDFNINDYLLPGIVPKITFIAGKLIGLTFNVAYNNANKQYTMDYYSDESGSYPNSLIYANIGDTYKLYDISMPQSYINEAALRLEQATQSYLDSHSRPSELYEAEIDEEYIQSKGIVLFLGDMIRIVSSSFQIDNLYDIKELNQGITNPNKYSIKFGDIIPKSLLNLLKSNNFKTQQSIYSVQNTQVTNNQVTNIMGQDLQWQDL
jgi:hypothetical protein